VESEDNTVFPFCCETRWLGIIDFLYRTTIQEGRLDIQMVHLLAVVSSYCEHKLNGLHPGNWSKYFIEVNALILHIPLHDES
jgi:hypothetical protein